MSLPDMGLDVLAKCLVFFSAFGIWKMVEIALWALDIMSRIEIK